MHPLCLSILHHPMANPYHPYLPPSHGRGQDSQDRARSGRSLADPHNPTHRYPSGQGPNPPPIRLMGPGQAPPPRPPGFPLRPQSFRPNEGQRGYPPNYPNRPRGSQQDQRTSFGPNQLPLYPLERFQVNCAPFRQPTEIGSFSYDEHRNFVMDDSQLKYYFPPDLRTTNNLSVNYEKYISRDSSVDEHIDALLDALMCIKIEEEQQHSSTPERPSITKADFICYRGMLTKIMCTPYAKNDAWEMGATLFNGTIYIEEHVSDEKRNEATSSDERHKLMSYWGYRFETICNISKPVSELRRIKTNKRTLPQQQEDETIAKAPKLDKDATHPGENSTTEDQNQNLEDAEDEFTEQIDLDDPELVGRLDGIVNTNFQYCTVARTRIGRNSIIMGAEVDCISEPKRPSHNPLSDYIELKTSRVISNARNRSTFERHKLLKFWAQSFLPGIPTIIVGFRDDDGNVVTVETFKTMEIPRLVRGKEGAWDSTVCINFLDGVLNFLRKQIVKDDPTVTYTIRWAPPFQAIEVEYAGQRRAFLTERFLKRWGHPPESAASTGG